MIIIALLYIALVWLIFFRFRLLRFNWPWRIVTVVLGVTILAVFLGLLSYLTPSGRIVVAGRVVEVTPNVAGTVTALPISPNTLVEAGTVLFQIDPTPYQTKVKQLAAALAEAVQKVDQLKASLDRASADVANLDFQLGYSRQRFADTERLARTSAVSEFSRQDAAVKVQSLVAQVEAAKANQRSARSAVESQIDGENTTVAQLSRSLKALSGNWIRQPYAPPIRVTSA
jgi:multidrug resistance efflux pump